MEIEIEFNRHGAPPGLDSYHLHLSVAMLARLRRLGFSPRLLVTDAVRITDWHRESIRYRASLLTLIENLGLQGAVEFRSADYADMPALYREADLVVYPTVGEEPYGLVPLEAMSCERPIVVARAGGLAETVLNGTTGFVVPKNSVEDLTQAVALLLDRHDQAIAMGVAGREHVKRRFTLDTYGTVLSRYYRRSTRRQRP